MATFRRLRLAGSYAAGVILGWLQQEHQLLARRRMDQIAKFEATLSDDELEVIHAKKEIIRAGIASGAQLHEMMSVIFDRIVEAEDAETTESIH